MEMFGYQGKAMSITDIRARHKKIIGMIHLQPLPGTPFFEAGNLDRILDTAVSSALALQAGGADGCLIQTVDRTYTAKDESDPARTVAMGMIVDAVARATSDSFKVGCQLMRNAVQASLAVAKVAKGDFIRVAAMVGSTQTASGLIEANPHALAEYRRKIDAWDIAVIADIHSMHFNWFGEAKPVAYVAHAARLAGADAVALGDRNDEVTLGLIESVRAAEPGLPIFLAGYTNLANAQKLLARADGAFVGTCLERDGWGGVIDADKVRAYLDIVRALPAQPDEH
ncbi:BtpA/SgcQ family protein [Pseudomonas fluorescens]|jgi:membrane complex biogenesis BtpA family protein|uniref:BtpA/SgcQ family protein n=1 Tax=Pseudomonas fluorescens TaxID=294 RepID=UPI001C831697|nr:BtpA/SgcQ family protein [Pseudomonas fluorescens]